MKTITLKPVDSFFFRGHAYADAGSDTTMTGFFPPRPNTIYNALRSAYIYTNSSFESFTKEENEELKRWMGSPDTHGDFRIKGLFISKKNQLVLPLPLDYQVVEDDESLTGYPLRIKQNDFFQSSNSTDWALYATVKNKKSKNAQGKFAYFDQWKQSVLNQTPIHRLLITHDFVDEYAKVGIHVDYVNKKAKNEYLYRMNMLSMKPDCSLEVLIDRTPDFTNVRFARLGGESRPWIVKQNSYEHPFFWNSKELQEIENQLRENCIARIILLTPSIWKQGSRPGSFDEVTGKLVLPNDITVEPIAWAVGRPEVFGGWDIVRNRPKQRQWMVPAGTVVYVRIDEEKISKLMNLANGFHFSDDLIQEGFGFSIISGVVKGG
ncbi:MULTISPECIES: type III-B CRISPR module-associated Cmr3 family protein [Ureibacillus]|jgi:CRISPR-associated protein Cmr3|uniref:Type III-B CRISPR module-associated protein Cmr3 n=2 Tax=Ureibacillus TaxID=160795 RepID=A0A540UVL4_9BACL|nr:type III-B CRISPR module-associated Cmr3 family protein [Ureibacillus terrenus]MED3763924.1 type III-B CRISPR module-associated Cmr3 family protein [Ureibacillus terrenus]TQE88535.1 type III-B CRISPR module-associated protein Cmr3 [Ureibacillus terrenus]